ncbi:MAG: 2-hydroxyacid dehydrogenase [Lachnospiraceae bacterium]|nr:2-hydroxyacid dehydrogenase [Lachnospiraceae bacterium]
MKILFYDTKNYDKESFEAILPKFAKALGGNGAEPDVTIEYVKSDLDPRTARMAEGFDAVCAFVSSDVGEKTLTILKEKGVGLVLMRCAGFNNVDMAKAKELEIRVMRVPGYSPEAVAEHAMALALASNRRLYKAYNKVRENDFSLNGLMGFNLYQKTAGIIGTGKIGAAMCRICHGFGMKVIAYDVYQNESLKDFVTYVTLGELLAQSDLISLHCPLMDSTYHLINIDTIKKMKDGVILVNTSRGALVKTEDLIMGIRMHKFAGVALDVYEEETPNVFENRSDEILEHSITARLLSFPNVMITSHQGFFTREALEAIAETTLQNACDYVEGKESPNDVK